jgi:hypothetical protein
MLCCVGLFGGIYVGQQLGGPWTVIAPAAGFGLGLMGDMKFMHKMHNHSPQKAKEDEIPDPDAFQKPKNESLSSQGGASKELFFSGDKYPDPP